MDSAFLRKFIQKTILVSNSPFQLILKGEFLFKNYLKNDLRASHSYLKTTFLKRLNTRKIRKKFCGNETHLNKRFMFSTTCAFLRGTRKIAT
ncbi:hypothetical protein B1J93_05860 [Leptospira kirschneri serovar Pomona]|uniref:Uncharacterized protein n=1 Tax=Leptospira kirschneri serovar Pomona TaxID=561005 RepID=A0A1T1DUH0_9LEPT|nr:hypothetical protein LEP1GSC198_0392 [Leptospira kirschneri str. JB]OOV44521.1 hypothetical protein B1J93_05860 [Leptospira kirschneri serovar Pomona]